MKVTIRKLEDGLSVYIPKKDLEAKVIATDPAHPFGGTLKLAGGTSIYVEPMTETPKLPITLRAKKV